MSTRLIVKLFTPHIVLLLTTIWAVAQPGKFVTKTISIGSDTTKYDEYATAPGSLYILSPSGDSIVHSSYHYDWLHSQIIWNEKPHLDSVNVWYYQLDFKSETRYQLRSTNIIQDELAIKYEENLLAKDRAVFYPGSTDELQKVGSISRGVAFGSNQNLSVNSNLDLQLSGNLTEDYVLSAALSDRNIPIQPEGTTSNIQEFDQVYVNVQGNGTNATLGDFFVMSDPDNYFLKTYKKTQGISATQVFSTASRTNTATVNLGIARGRFARNTFNGEEGNQGPYRLYGENGELYIIVIAGTERVYVNGNLLERGEQNQYTIDYNSGELVFTPRQLITSNDRIIVEFQYADNSYERSLSHIALSSRGDKGKWTINYYSEQDNRNKPFFTTFSSSDIQLLAQSGDNTDQSVKLSEDTAGISENTITYQKIDSITMNGIYQGVYVRSDLSDAKLYKVTFSFVGKGKGDYVEEKSLVNGRVYKWVEPVNGGSQGSYAPIIKLIAPKRTRLITGSYQGKIQKNTSIFSEIALSNHDINTFSNLNSNDDDGFGYRFGIKHGDSILNNNFKLSVEAISEYTSSNFNTIERFRSVEFSRVWNRQLSNQTNVTNGSSSLLMNGASLGLGYRNIDLSHQINILSLDTLFNGIQNLSTASWHHKRINIDALNELVESSSNQGFESEFMGFSKNQQLAITMPFRFFKAGIQISEETNLYRLVKNDSLLPQSYSSAETQAYLQNHDSSKVDYRLSIGKRAISLLHENELVVDNRSTDLKSEISIGKSANFNLNVNTTYRIYDKTIGDSLDENTLLNRIEYRARALKGLFQTNSYYQIGTGRERQYEILYLYIGRGLGDFVWADINGNGDQDLGEFRPQEYTGQGDYVRTVINSNRYVNAVSNEFFQTLNFQPASIWSGNKGFLGGIAKFSDQATFSINSKTKDNNSFSQLNPFRVDIAEESLVSTQTQLRNSVYYNRLSSKFGIEYTWFKVSGKNLFVYGFEGSDKMENLVQLRWNLSSIFSLFPVYSQGVITSNSESFSQKNYILDYRSLKLKSQFQSGTSTRLAANAEWYTGVEPADSSAQVDRKLLGVEFTLSKALFGAITAKVDYIKVDFKGEKNTPIGFNMLNGLQPGNNITWSVLANYQLSKQAQIGINYEGRFSVINKVIQTGSVNARWLF